MNPQIAFEGYMPIDATRDQGIGLEFRGGVQAPNLVDARMDRRAHRDPGALRVGMLLVDELDEDGGGR